MSETLRGIKTLRGPAKGSQVRNRNEGRTLACQDCGTSFWGRSTAKYCLDCKVKRIR